MNAQPQVLVIERSPEEAADTATYLGQYLGQARLRTAGWPLRRADLPPADSDPDVVVARLPDKGREAARALLRVRQWWPRARLVLVLGEDANEHLRLAGTHAEECVAELPARSLTLEWIGQAVQRALERAGTQAHAISGRFDVSDPHVLQGAFRTLGAMVGVGLVLLSPEGVILHANPTFTRTLAYGAGELDGVDLEAITHPEDILAERWSMAELKRQQRGFYAGEKRCISRGGQTLWTSILVAPILRDQPSAGLLMVIMPADSPSRRGAVQAANRQAIRPLARMTTLSWRERANAVAHDFNNILTLVAGYCQMARSSPQDTALMQMAIDKIAAVTVRATNLVRQLSDNRADEWARCPVNLNDIIAPMAEVIPTMTVRPIEVVIDLAPELKPILADPSRVDQIVVNLIHNAVDALEPGGRVSVHTALQVVRAGDAEHDAGIPPGNYIVLEVADTGSGMNERTLVRVFEPYFTTKEPGRGSGLGLPSVRENVHHCGGEMLVRSEPGKGSSFRVFFPLLPNRTACLGDEATRNPTF